MAERNAHIRAPSALLLFSCRPTRADGAPLHAWIYRVHDLRSRVLRRRSGPMALLARGLRCGRSRALRYRYLRAMLIFEPRQPSSVFHSDPPGLTGLPSASGFIESTTFGRGIWRRRSGPMALLARGLRCGRSRALRYRTIREANRTGCVADGPEGARPQAESACEQCSYSSPVSPAVPLFSTRPTRADGAPLRAWLH